jgi:hypothetical protein
MKKHAGLGVEFDLWGFEIPEGHEAGSSNPYYADLVAKVLQVAETEGFGLDVTDQKDFHDTALIDRMQELGEAERQTALMYDHEVPAVLGIFRIALANMLDEDRDRMIEDSYSRLPPGSMRILIGSLEEYETMRENS